MTLCYQKNLVEKAIENGADINAVDERKRTPLHFAVRGFDPEGETTAIVGCLLAHDAKTNVYDKNGETPCDFYLDDMLRRYEFSRKRTIKLSKLKKKSPAMQYMTKSYRVIVKREPK